MRQEFWDGGNIIYAKHTVRKFSGQVLDSRSFLGGTCKGKLTPVHSAFTSTDTRNPHKQQKDMQLRNVSDTVQMQSFFNQ